MIHIVLSFNFYCFWKTLNLRIISLKLQLDEKFPITISLGGIKIFVTATEGVIHKGLNYQGGYINIQSDYT